MGDNSQNKVVPAPLGAIDDDLLRAGLVRSPRRKEASKNPVPRIERTEPEDLSCEAPVPIRAQNGVRWLPVADWPEWVWAGFSTRGGGLSRGYCAEDAPGELNLGYTPDEQRETVAANRRLLAEAVTGAADTPVIAIRQFHSDLVVQTAHADTERENPRKADGQMTDEPGFLLAVQTADCIPVLVADRRRRVVAAFHAGWRGTVSRIVEKGVGRMRLAFASRPEHLIAAIGPGIGPCCYAVGEEVLSALESQFAYARELFHEVYDTDPVRKRYPMLFLTQRAPGHSAIGPSLHVDLTEANRRQLLDAGLRAESIQTMGGCTQCHAELLFSHRGSQGHAGRMMAVIGIRGEKGRTPTRLK